MLPREKFKRVQKPRCFFRKKIQDWFWNPIMLFTINTKERRGAEMHRKLLKKTVMTNNQQQSERALEPSATFSNAAIKSRSVKKVEKPLPKSFRRKRKVISRSTSKYQVCQSLRSKSQFQSKSQVSKFQKLA